MVDPVVLPPKLDLSTITRFHEQLEPLLNADLVLDGSNLVHFGALGVQTLMAVAVKLAADNHTLSIINLSDRIIDQLSAMGLSPETLAGDVK